MLSVIVPTYNDERAIVGLLADMQLQQAAVEVILSDGGSTDGTLAVSGNVKIVSGERCVVCQLNAGAEQATGDVFLFLLPSARLTATCIKELLQLQAPFWGSFKKRSLHEKKLFADFVSNMHARFSLPTLHHGLFVTKDLFEQAGGFTTEERPGEDLIAALKKATRATYIKSKVLSPVVQ